MPNSVSGKTELDNLIPEIWATEMYDELRATLGIAAVFERKYEGEIRNKGDKVKVNQIVAANGEILTDDKETFNAETMVVNQFELTVNKRAVAAFEFTDLAQLQSDDFAAEAQEALVYAVRKQIEDSVIAALVPGAGLTINPAAASDLAPVDLASLRRLQSKQMVPKTNRHLFLDVDYYSDLLTKTSFTSSDFVGGDQPVTSGVLGSPLYGYQIQEIDNLPDDTGFAVHSSALQLAMQQSLRIKISDQHSSKKFGFVMSADLIFDHQLFANNRIAKIEAP